MPPPHREAKDGACIRRAVSSGYAKSILPDGGTRGKLQMRVGVRRAWQIPLAGVFGAT